MKAIDRIILVALVAGVWALVLKPGMPGAMNGSANHACSVSGKAKGSTISQGRYVVVDDFSDVRVSCSH